MTICDSEITCKVLEGEEEEEYLSKVKEGIRSKNKFKMRSGKKGKDLSLQILQLSIFVINDD